MPILRHPPVFQDLFVSGNDGYHTYRIPALIEMPSSRIIAFCEGRHGSDHDSGRIDILARISNDGGASWDAPFCVWSDPDNTCGNPCPTIDPYTGDLLLLACWNKGSDTEQAIIQGLGTDTRRVYLLRSRDEGSTWSDPAEITHSVKRPEWTWYATGPGAAITLQRSKFRNRILVPCDHILDNGESWHSHTIYSDDGGQSWQLGGCAQQGTNECQAVELSDGRILLNMRNRRADGLYRQIAFSEDGGASWEEQRHDPNLPDPVCQAAIRRIQWPDHQQRLTGQIAFANPIGPYSTEDGGRRQLTLRISTDDCQSWPASLLLHQGPAAYSDITSTRNGTLLCLFECGEQRPNERLRLARICS